MSGFRNPAIDGPARRDFERTGKSDIPNWIDEPAATSTDVATDLEEDTPQKEAA